MSKKRKTPVSTATSSAERAFTTGILGEPEAEAALDKLAYEKYPQLTEMEIQTLVVDDKWLTTLAMAVQGELDRVSQTLTGRIRQLAERYATPLPKLVEEVDNLSAQVEKHLKKMGFEKWRIEN